MRSHLYSVFYNMHHVILICTGSPLTNLVFYLDSVEHFEDQPCFSLRHTNQYYVYYLNWFYLTSSDLTSPSTSTLWILSVFESFILINETNILCTDSKSIMTDRAASNAAYSTEATETDKACNTITGLVSRPTIYSNISVVLNVFAILLHSKCSAYW